jgi:hypothetical protein
MHLEFEKLCEETTADFERKKKLIMEVRPNAEPGTSICSLNMERQERAY